MMYLKYQNYIKYFGVSLKLIYLLYVVPLILRFLACCQEAIYLR